MNPEARETQGLERGSRFGRYEVERLLGQGGMGAAYLCRDTFLGRPVVLKVILGASATDPTILERFRREAQAGARIDCENVVKVFEVGRTPDRKPFIAMEYVDGFSIAEVAHLGMLEPPLVAALMHGMARGLVAAHAAGIVHRDVKPSNGLICRDGRVKLADFGVAKFLTGVGGQPPLPDLTRPGTIVGTPAYIAPEQTLGSDVDGRADVYALGVSFYERLAGKVPFEAASIVDLLGMRFTENPRPLHELVPSLPTSFAQVCMAFLAVEPTKRPTSREAVAMLECLLPPQPARALAGLFADPKGATLVGVDTRLVRTYALATPDGPTFHDQVRPPGRPLATTAAMPAGSAPAAAPARTEAVAAPGAADRRTLQAALFALGSIVLAATAITLAILLRAPALPASPPPVAPPTAPSGLPPRTVLATAIALRDPAKVLAARDVLRAAPGTDASILQAADDAAQLLQGFVARVRELGLTVEAGTLDDLFRALVDASARAPTRFDQGFCAAAILLAAIDGTAVPTELYMLRDANGDAADKLRRVLKTLGLEYPRLR
jgi:serine/threonine-protein kinase